MNNSRKITNNSRKDASNDRPFKWVEKENKRPQAAPSNKVTQRASTTVSSPSSKLQGAWATKSKTGTSIVEGTTSPLIPKPLEERDINMPVKKSRDQKPIETVTAKPEIKQRKALKIEPKLKAPQTVIPAPRNYVNSLNDSNNHKVNPDLEYFNSLTKHSKINNLCLDKKTKCEYRYIQSSDDAGFKEQLKLNVVYRKLGLFVPESKILNIGDGQYVFLVKSVSAKKPSEYLLKATEGQRDQFYAQVCKAFAADILFMNMSVLCGDLDTSYLVNEKGAVCRSSISMLSAFTKDTAYPTEIWDSRDSVKNLHGHMIWSGLTIVEIAKQILSLIKSSNDFFYGLSQKQKAIADRRLTNLLIIANKTVSMSNDGWNVEYIDNLNKHMLCLKKAGCEEKLPLSLYPNPEKKDVDCKLRGPTGILFEGLRGKNSVVQTVLIPYVAENNGDYQVIIDWMVGHESSGWSEMSQVLMHFLTLHRLPPNKGYFWKEGKVKAESYYNDYVMQMGRGDAFNGANIIENSFMMLHAFTQIVLGHIDFPHNNLGENGEEGSVRFFRSENKHVMSDQRIWDFKSDINMQMGVYSSGSVVAYPPLVHGTEVTERIIPHHRVIALYFMLRTLQELYRGAFSNDYQNEFTAILGGINCDYIDSLKKN